MLYSYLKLTHHRNDCFDGLGCDSLGGGFVNQSKAQVLQVELHAFINRLFDSFSPFFREFYVRLESCQIGDKL